MFRLYCGDHVNSGRFPSYLAFIKDPMPITNSFIRFMARGVESDKKLQSIVRLENLWWYEKLFNMEFAYNCEFRTKLA